MTSTMYDSAYADTIPADAPAVAGYIDGAYKSYPDLVARFGTNIPIISITVFGAAGARVGDCEAGNMTPGQVAAWAQREVFAGRRPTIYHDVDLTGPISVAVDKLGITGQVDHWVADWTYIPHMAPGSVATQWANPPRTGGGFDVSTALNSWLGIVTPPSDPGTVINGKGTKTMASLEDDTFLHVWATIPVVGGASIVYHWWQYLPGKGTNPPGNWFTETMPQPDSTTG